MNTQTQEGLIKSLTVALILLFGSNASIADVLVEYDRAKVREVSPITKSSFKYIPRTRCRSVSTSIEKSVDTIDASRSQVISISQPTEVCDVYRDKEYTEEIVGYNVTFEYKGHLRSARFRTMPRRDFILIKKESRIYAIE